MINSFANKPHNQVVFPISSLWPQSPDHTDPGVAPALDLIGLQLRSILYVENNVCSPKPNSTKNC